MKEERGENGEMEKRRKKEDKMMQGKGKERKGVCKGRRRREGNYERGGREKNEKWRKQR